PMDFIASRSRGTAGYSEHLERGFGLLWPSPHAHLAKHRDGDTELFSRLLLVARLGGQFSESEMALRFQRAHLELAREGQGLVIGLSSPVGVRRVPVAMDVAKQKEGAGFFTPLPELASEIQRALPPRHRLVDPPRSAVRIAHQCKHPRPNCKRAL